MSILELSVVIVVAISLMTLLFIGARGWKRGSDRASCIMNIRQVQQAVRNYSATHQYYPGQDVTPHVRGGSLYLQLVGAGKYVEEVPVCQQGGVYENEGNIVPRIGELYMSCSLATDDADHKPEDHRDW